MLQKQAIINSAEAQLIDAKHSFLPRAVFSNEVSLGSANNLPGSFLPTIGVFPSVSAGIRAANKLNPAMGNLASLYSDYELVNFGLKKARVKSAEAYIDVTRSDLERQVYLLEWNVCRLYFDLLKEQAQLGVNLQNINRYDSIFRVIRAITLSGIKPGADTSLALTELSKTRITYNQSLGRINQLKQQLSFITGLAATAIAIDTSVYASKLTVEPIVAGDTSTTSHPLVLYFEKQQQLFKSNEEVVKKSYQPKIMVAAALWARGSSIDNRDVFKALPTGLAYQRFNYSAGISFVYDLFNGTRKKDKSAVSHYQTLAGEQELAQQKLVLNNAAGQADEAINIAEKNLAEIPVQLQAAKDVYGQKLAQYRAGLSNLIDLTNAAFVLYRSETDRIDALNSWFIAGLEKAAASGNLDPFIQSIKY